MAVKKIVGSPRERLLAAANRLFYEEGVQSVGIDRVIEQAGVAKASLYSSFGSKEELVRAYLSERAASRQERIMQRLTRHSEPRARILAIFELLEEIAAEPTFRGCAFVNASAEEPRGDTKVRRVCAESRAWTRGLFTDLARATGAADAARLGYRLHIIYDGAVVAAYMDRDPSAAAEAREMAEVLLDAAVPAPARGRRRPS